MSLPSSVRSGASRVEVDHGRHAAVGEREHLRVDLDLALLQVPVRPHRLVRHDVAGRRLARRASSAARAGSRSAWPTGRARRRRARPRSSPGRSRPPSRRCPLGDTKPVTSTPERIVTPSDSHLPTRPGDRVEVEREAALLLVQADRDVLRAPVGEELLHVRVDLGLAEDQLGLVADPLMALVDLREVALLALRRRARCSRPGCTRRPRDPTPRPRRTPASARPSPAGSSCCGRRRRRCPMRRRRARSCRPRGCRCPSR